MERRRSRSSIRSPKAFATTIVTRLCLDRLKSARATREEYIGPWLPEPVLTSEVEGPDTMLQRAESVTLAFLVLLEKLSPEERAVFLLKDIFEYDHAEISDMLGTTVENSRQLLHRAKAKLADGRPTLTGSAQSRRAIAETIRPRVLVRRRSRADGAAREGRGDVERRRRQGVGGSPSAARPGSTCSISWLVFTGPLRTWTCGDVSLAIEDVNSEPALVLRIGGRLESLFVFSIDDDDAISAIRVVRNPDKLARIDHQLGAGAEGQEGRGRLEVRHAVLHFPSCLSCLSRRSPACFPPCEVATSASGCTNSCSG